MNKTITIIQLLNKIANGEEVPKKLIFQDREYIKDDNNDFIYIDKDYMKIHLFNDLDYINNMLNDEVEIIEEQDEIDIQPLNAYKLIEVPYMKECLDKNDYTKFCELLKQSELELVENIEKLAQAIKQLDKKINK